MERLDDTTFARPFVDGRVLRRGEAMDDDFFPRLRTLLDEVHARRVAVVDLQKSENVLVDEAGRPWLFDLGAAWHWPAAADRRGWQRLVPQRLGEWALRRFQTADVHHVLKQWRRSRPDTISAEDLARTRRPGAFIKAHRVLMNAWRGLRRRFGFGGGSQ